MFCLFYTLNISCRLYSYDLPNQLQPTKPSARRLDQAEGAASWKQHMAMGCTTHKQGGKTLGICWEVSEIPTDLQKKSWKTPTTIN